MRVALYIDEFDGRITGYKTYPIQENDIVAEINDLEWLKKLKANGIGAYYENGKIIKRIINADDLSNRIRVLEKEYNELKAMNERDFLYKAWLDGKSLDQAKKNWYVMTQKREKIEEELAQLQRERLNRLKEKTIESERKNQYRYYCSICLIIRDENEYLKEWLEWHIGQGVEHFYIYDHGSKSPVKDYITTLNEEIQNRVTVIDFSGSHEFAQHEAYNNCLQAYENESKWIGFIDSDEMVRVKNGKTIPEFLRDYEDYAGLFMKWIVYNANGQKEKQDIPCRKRFLKVSPCNRSNNLGKVFVQPKYFQYMMIHNGYPKRGFEVVDEHKLLVDEGAISKLNATSDWICVDHYYTKSYEEWVEKIKRGACDPYYSRKYEEFFYYNPDMEYCREEEFPIQEYEISKK